MSEDANDFLMGGGGPPSISFKDPATKGQWFGGKVLKTPGKEDVTQESKPDGELRFFKNGEPIMQVAIVLQAVAPTADDDGARRLFVRSVDRKALKEAVEEAGAKGVYEGGELYVMWFGDEPATVKGNNDRKLKRFAYKPPTANDVLMGDSPFKASGEVLHVNGPAASGTFTPTTVAGSGSATLPMAAQPPAAAPPVLKGMTSQIPPAPPGFDAQQWQAATPEQRAGILALMGTSVPF